MVATYVEPREKRPFGLFLALALSILIHLLLVVLTVWFPLNGHSLISDSPYYW